MHRSVPSFGEATRARTGILLNVQFAHGGGQFRAPISMVINQLFAKPFEVCTAGLGITLGLVRGVGEWEVVGLVGWGEQG